MIPKPLQKLGGNSFKQPLASTNPSKRELIFHLKFSKLFSNSDFSAHQALSTFLAFQNLSLLLISVETTF